MHSFSVTRYCPRYQQPSPFHVARVWLPRKRDSTGVNRFARRCGNNQLHHKQRYQARYIQLSECRMAELKADVVVLGAGMVGAGAVARSGVPSARLSIPLGIKRGYHLHLAPGGNAVRCAMPVCGSISAISITV
jgi:hypothetical protein